MAVGVGFEPTELLHSTIFKTAAFDHSAIPPFNILAENIVIVNAKHEPDGYPSGNSPVA